jgi:exosome complex RNA-binding protein Rrp42 (RNase PH superfamily)
MPTAYSPSRLSQVTSSKTAQSYVLVCINGEVVKIQKMGGRPMAQERRGMKTFLIKREKKKWAVFLSLSNLPHP